MRLEHNSAESGMVHSLQAEYSKEESKDIVGPEELKDVGAGTQLQSSHPMKLAKDHGQSSNSTTCVQVRHTLQKHGVVIASSFSTQPWIPTLLPLFRTTRNLQVPLSILLLSRDSRIYRCWFLYFLAQEHMITGISNFTAPSPTIYNLSQVILSYATLIQSLILLRTHISIYKRIQNVSMPPDTGALIIWNEWI